jgi:thiamine pyrophosphate-dependent acetolactate synthase large subunit-like protein
MSEKSMAAILVETLVAAGVKRVDSVVGDSLNGFLGEIGRGKKWVWLPVIWIHIRPAPTSI